MKSSITGFNQLQDELDRLAGKQGVQIGRAVTLAGCNAAAGVIRSMAADPTVANAIGVSVKGGYRTQITGKVGVNVGSARRTHRWAPILVVGSDERFRRTRQGARTGRIVGTDVVRRGMSAARGKVRAAMRSEFRKQMAKLKGE